MIIPGNVRGVRWLVRHGCLELVSLTATSVKKRKDPSNKINRCRTNYVHVLRSSIEVLPLQFDFDFAIFHEINVNLREAGRLEVCKPAGRRQLLGRHANLSE